MSHRDSMDSEVCRFVSGAAALMCTLLLLGTSAAHGEDSETQALRKEVEELKQKVQRLEEQQQIPKPGPAQASPSAPPGTAPGQSTVGEPAAGTSMQPSRASRVPGAAEGGRMEAQPGGGGKPTVESAAQPPSQPSSAASGHPTTLSPNPATGSVSVPALRESWSRVNKGMSEAEIAELLGAPTTETYINGRRVWYYYYPGIGGASVFFRGDSRVSSHQAPFIGWW